MLPLPLSGDVRRPAAAGTAGPASGLVTVRGVAGCSALPLGNQRRRRRLILACLGLLLLAALSPIFAGLAARNAGAVFLLRAVGPSPGALFDPVGLLPTPNEESVRAATWLRRADQLLPGQTATERLAVMVDLAAGQPPGCAGCSPEQSEAAGDSLLGALWAIARYRAGQTDEAIAIWRSLGAADLLGGFAEQARAAGRPDAALEAARLALATDPESASRWLNLAAALADLNRGDEAIEAYQRAAALGSASAPAYDRQALLLHQRGRNAEALEAVDRALTLHPDYGPYLLTKADILIALGQREGADAIYADLQERNWNLAWVLAKRGENLVQLGRATEGVASIERAVELAPDNWNVWYTLGLAYRQSTPDPSKSTQAFERVVALAPSYPWGHLLLGQAYEATGRLAEAEAHYRQASQLDPSNQAVRDAWRRLAPSSADAS